MEYDSVEVCRAEDSPSVKDSPSVCLTLLTSLWVSTITSTPLLFVVTKACESTTPGIQVRFADGGTKAWVEGRGRSTNRGGGGGGGEDHIGYTNIHLTAAHIPQKQGINNSCSSRHLLWGMTGTGSCLE